MSSSPSLKYRIAFVADWDANNPSAMSGAAFYMKRAFLALGHEIVDVFPTSNDVRARLLLAPGYVAKKAYEMRGLYYSPKRHPLYVGAVSAHASAKIKRDGRIDFIFAQSSAPIGRLDTKLPIVMTSDQPFDLYLDGYVPNPAPRFVREGRALEDAVAAKAASYIFPSEWAKEAFSRAHPDRPDVAHCIPWGANLDSEPDAAQIKADIVAKASQRKCRFLFVGRDWTRKRGDLVLKTVDMLRESGLDVGLDIVGAGDVDVGGRSDITVNPFIDKMSTSGKAELTRLLRQAHFLFVPSKAEAYGHVFCEAAAFGVPSVSSQVGGIPTIIKNGLNGLCLPLAASEADYAAAIRKVLATEQNYTRMASEARMAYTADLSWQAFATKTLSLVSVALPRGTEQSKERLKTNTISNLALTTR